MLFIKRNSTDDIKLGEVHVRAPISSLSPAPRLFEVWIKLTAVSPSSTIPDGAHHPLSCQPQSQALAQGHSVLG